jgi:hypothetical protein
MSSNRYLVYGCWYNTDELVITTSTEEEYMDFINKNIDRFMYFQVFDSTTQKYVYCGQY